MAVSPLPGQPVAVWTVRRSQSDAFDSYIVVSFSNATLVLVVGETVEEVSDSGFLGSVPSLAVGLLADDSLLQVRFVLLALCFPFCASRFVLFSFCVFIFVPSCLCL